MSAIVVVLIALLYGATLFLVAWWGDRSQSAAWISRRAPVIYALAIMVYCTSWTFYGAVGTASTQGWSYLPIYLGPALVFLFAPQLLRRIVHISQQQNIATLSDFLGARYGRSRLLAAVVTVLATAGALPYIALQLKSVGMSFSALTGAPQSNGGAAVLVAALALAAFSVAFGVRNADATRTHPGLALALAFESVVKLVGLIAVAVFSVVISGRMGDVGSGLSAGGGAAATRLDPVFALGPPSLQFVTLTLLSMAAIICLPRQFHVLVAEAPKNDPDAALRAARWLAPLYLGLTSLVIVPITLAGARLLPASTSADTTVIALPLAFGAEGLAAFVFIGGLAAATGMIIISAIALSTMITHDLVVPALLRARPRTSHAGVPVAAMRRIVIVGLIAGAYCYLQLTQGSAALAQIGLIAFVAAAQLAPAMIGAVAWRGGRRIGALAGIGAGGAVWAYTLVLPALAGEAWLAQSGLSTVWGGALNPHGLLGVKSSDPVTHAAVWSMLVNTGLFVGLSLRAPERLIDRVQASAFVRDSEDERDDPRAAHRGQVTNVTVGELQSLCERFFTREATAQSFSRFGREIGVELTASTVADWDVIQRTERLLVGAVGSSTARIVMASALTNTTVPFADMLAVLDETREDRRFKRHLLQSTLENLRQGVSVVDTDLRLVAWNGAYLELFRFPPGLIHVGRPIEDVIRNAAARGELGPGDIELQVSRRLSFLRAGGPHEYERVNADGRVLRIEGNPMPGGGYVTTYTDITRERVAERAVRQAKENLEHRVAARTAELAAMAEERDLARHSAEASEATKTRFLAAASHDLQQPLNAARLFAGALREEVAQMPGVDQLAGNIDRSIRSADRMLRGLLDISKFDADGVRPTLSSFAVAEFFEELEHAHRPVAQDAGLQLRLRPGPHWIRTDRDLMRSIMQNLVSNALRYTQAGGVLVAARPLNGGARVALEVWDTGPGVPEDARERIFQEFRRLHDTDRSGERGAGLGLAIAARAAAILDTSISVSSQPGRGSVFRVSAPAAERHATPRAIVAPVRGPMVLDGLKVLCLDDEPGVLDAMNALLTRWGCRTTCLSDAESAERAALDCGPFDVALVDFHLEGAATGHDVLNALARAGSAPAKRAILTADLSDYVAACARQNGATVIAKPVDPDRLREFLA